MNLAISKLKFELSRTSRIYFLVIPAIIISSCSSVKKIAVETDASRLLKASEVFSNQFTGFSLLDLENNKIIAGHNATLKFTPASNTKLLTMYATLKSFPDSIPSFLIQKTGTDVILQPLGDPTFLYAPFQNQVVFNRLSDVGNIQISWPDEPLEPYGPGWAWDDYFYDFQPQRSWWPIYGNVVNVQKKNDTIKITPPFFKEDVELVQEKAPIQSVNRERTFNLFKVYVQNDTSDLERSIPFEYSKELLITLLRDTLNTSVSFTSSKLTFADTLYSQHVNTVLAHMLKPSDNFLAEQLLILAAWKNGFKDVKSFIKYIQPIWLSSLTEMVWVDGSGLSRYNLISPIDQVRLLKQCYDEFGWDRVTALLPSGGQGTLKEHFLSEEPYIFAKTGTLSNNHNLSGYLITKSGKRMIFSFMSNHYTRPSDEVKQAMEAFLVEIRNAY